MLNHPMDFAGAALRVRLRGNDDVVVGGTMTRQQRNRL